MQQEKRHLHLVSDATGETINSITRACLIQFDAIDVQEHLWSLIRTQRQLDIALEGIKHWPGMVLYTFVDDVLRKKLVNFCCKENIPSVSVLDPVMSALSIYFDAPSGRDPGRQHVLDSHYYARIDAVEYALATDDGNRVERIQESEVLILGVSRTSKTPTCVYLAHRGVKAANIPIVPGVPLPDLSGLKNTLIVGLTKEADSLVEIRHNRMKMLQEGAETPYVDPEQVREELYQARKIFAQLGCPVIDVTRRSVEETASEILMLMTKRDLLMDTERA